MDIDSLTTEYDRLILTEFTEETALRLGLTLVNMAKLDKLGIVINIRTADRTLFHAALAGSGPINDNWARRKSNVALAYQAPSMLVRLRMQAKGDTLAIHGFNEADYAIHGGAVPLRVKGVGVVAVVTVSGLPQADDHALAVRAIETLLPA